MSVTAARAPRRAAPVQPMPPGRRARKKERTRRDIYEAAMALFRQRGYDAVTVEEITEAADVARATFFLHFASKSALVAEFNRLLVARLEAHLAAQPAAAAEDRIRQVVAFGIREWGANATVMRQMVRDFYGQPALPRAMEEANEDIVTLVADIVREGQARGEFRPGCDPLLVAASLVSVWCTITVKWSADESGATDPVELHRQFLDLILGGLKAAPRRRGPGRPGSGKGSTS